MKKHPVILTLLLFALIAAAAAGGIYIYSSLAEKNGQEDFEAFTARAEEFEREKSVTTFGRVYAGSDGGNVMGLYFYRFDNELYMNVEYLSGSLTERELRVTEVRLGKVDYDFSEISELTRVSSDTCLLTTDKGDTLLLTVKVNDSVPYVTVKDADGVLLYETGVKDNEPDFTYPTEAEELTVGGTADIGYYPLEITADGTVSYKGSTVSTGTDGASAVCAYYLPRSEDSFFIVLSLKDGNSDFSTALLRYGPEGFTLLDTAEGRVKTAAPDGGSVSIETREDLFGSYDALRDFAAGDTGLTAETGFYTFENEPDPDFWQNIVISDEKQQKLVYATRAADGSRILTLAEETTAFDATGREITLFPGTVLVPLGYEPAAARFDFTVNGAEYSFTYGIDETTWSYAVNGVSEHDLFEGVDYDYD